MYDAAVALVSFAAGLLVGYVVARARAPRCTLGHFLCQAFSWPSCSDGRCSYHCQHQCKCLPVADGRSLRVIDGGRGKP